MTRQEILQTAKPILFNTDMVRAILDGRKTVTRRVIRVPSEYLGRQVGESGNQNNPLGFKYVGGIVRPKYNKGDILYVRETWLKADDGYHYKADIETPSESEDLRLAYGYKYKPSIHMPKEAARIFLRVTGVWVERLQDITPQQLAKEGFGCNGHGVDETWYDAAHKDYAILWNSTIKKSDLDKYSWDANPYVWVYEFERVR